MNVPQGYRLERDPDTWTLIGPSGEVVARFVAGASDEDIEQVARQHMERNQ